MSANSRSAGVEANFVLTSSRAREGDGVVNLAVSFGTNYSGLLRYRVADMSTAVSGEDFAPVPGTVAVHGNNAVIPITVLDDTNIEPVKLLVVDLVEDPQGNYQVGSTSRHLVQLYDNDTYWSGVMGTTNSTQLGFRLRLLRVGPQVVSAALVSELSTNRSQGVGTIPVGVWPVRATLTTNSFQAVSAPIPMGTSRLTGKVQLQRLLTFTAEAGNPNHLVRSNLILGTFTDRLQATDPGVGWVGGSVSGVVALMEDVPAAPLWQMPGTTASASRPTVRTKGGGQ
jgi:hypothetical protein